MFILLMISLFFNVFLFAFAVSCSACIDELNRDVFENKRLLADAKRELRHGRV